MAVAVKNPESQTRSAAGSLLVSSVAGAAFVIVCAAVVFWGVPYLWQIGIDSHLPDSMRFVSYAALIVIEAVTIGILAFLGMALVGPAPLRGLRAGVFSVLAWLFLTGVVTVVAGRLFQAWFGKVPAVGIGLTAAVGLGLLYWGWALVTRPKAADWLRTFEDQNWFTITRFKASQGQRVRRATMLGIILLVGAGIYALYNHGTLATADNNWTVRIPFTDRLLFLLPDVKFTIPLLLAAAGLWIAFRVVNLPVFADFLIATEAELNKVSWPTRKSVVQDTIVVLTTVLLLTVFLFLVDLGWGALLSWSPVGILRVQPQTQTQQQETIDRTPY
jgi:preprotein translocase SecE subunit